MRVTIIDYGLGNLHSVAKALDHVGAAVEFASDGKALESAERIVLPGVGAFADGMKGLEERGHADALKKIGKQGVPILGICLGAQLLMEESDEFGRNVGLGLIPGRVEVLPVAFGKVPHVGWARLQTDGRAGWIGTPLAGTPEGTWAYFVHSFQMVPSNPRNQIAFCVSGQTKLTAAVSLGPIVGLQFHPEKSGRAGLAMLAEFMRLPVANS